MKQYTRALGAFFLGIGLTGLVRAVSEPPAAPAASKLIEAQLQAAREAFEITDRDTVDREKLHTWSLRWMEAEQALKPGKADQAQAAQAHLERMKRLEDACAVAFKKGLGPKVDVVAAVYFRAKAERLLAKAKSQ